MQGLMLIIFWQILCKLTIIVKGQSQIELQFTSISTQTDIGTKENINLITNAVEQLIRPESDKYPYVVLEDQDKHNGILKLIYPDIKRGSPKTQIRIKISKADLKKAITVFPAGSRGFGFPVKQSFIVLRQSALNKTMHYLNLAYIRRTGQQIIIEWSTIDPNNFGKNRLDFEICRADECDMPQFIFGTCSIVSNKCPIPISQHGNITLLNKWTWTGDKTTSDSEPSNQLQNINLNNLQAIAPSPYSQQFKSPNSGVTFNFSISNQNTRRNKPVPSKKYSYPPTPYTNSVPIPGSIPSNPVFLIQTQPQSQYTSKVVTNENPIPTPDAIPFSQEPQTLRKKRDDKKKDKEDEEPEIPNSLDLLLLKRSDDKSPPGSADADAHFQNSLLTTRQVEDLENDDMECFECEKMGEFFDDFEEEPEFAKLVGEHARKQLSQRTTVTNSGDPVGTDILKLYPSVPYIGYGNCNFTLEDILKPKSKEIDDLIEFLLASLRLTCEWSSENRIRSIFRSKMKLIEIQDDFTASISPHSPIIKYKIVTQNEFNSLMTAIVLTKYTQLYRQDEAVIMDQLHAKPNNTNSSTSEVVGIGSSIVDHPPHNFNDSSDQSTLETIGNDTRISKRMKFLTKLILSVTETLNKRFSQHLIKGLRMLLRFLKDKFLSLIQESLAPPKQGSYGQGSVDNSEDENRHDQNQIMALKEFLLYGLGPLVKSGTSSEASFRSFSAVNHKRIKVLVQAYHSSLSTGQASSYSFNQFLGGGQLG